MVTRTEVPAGSDPKHATRIASAYPLPHCPCALSAALKKSCAQSVTSWTVPHTSPRVIVTVNLSIVASSLFPCPKHLLIQAVVRHSHIGHIMPDVAPIVRPVDHRRYLQHTILVEDTTSVRPAFYIDRHIRHERILLHIQVHRVASVVQHAHRPPHFPR